MSGLLRRLLAVEDEPNDAMLLREALALTPGAKSCRLDVAASVREALALLRRDAATAGAAGADLVLCDLRMPGEDGFDFLRQARADRLLRATPVLILSTSVSPEDVRRAYELGANGYLPKPDGLDRLVALLESLQKFWFEFARVPAQLP